MANTGTCNRVTDEQWQQRWEKTRAQAAQHLIDETGAMKRHQIDTWAAVDDLGLTVYEFRVLYCIARHEKWKTLPGGHRQHFENGCYASAETIQKITGISRNKIFEVLEVLRAAKIIKKLQSRSKSTRSGVKLAGWTNEFQIQPITDWDTPWDLIKTRDSVQSKRKQTPAESKGSKSKRDTSKTS